MKPRRHRYEPARLLHWPTLGLAAALLGPPLLGLAMIARFFGGMDRGLWWLAAAVFVFGLGLVVGLARLARKPAGPLG